MNARERLLTRIGEINDFTRPRPLVTVAEFFEGNDDPASIGYNLPDPPHPQDFHVLLREILGRPEVSDVRIEVKDLEDPDGWPSSDTIWIFTSAAVDVVEQWFPERLRPDSCEVVGELGPGVETYPVAPGCHAISAWYD